jgi:4'-phosphopantetheinyl transferase
MNFFSYLRRQKYGKYGNVQNEKSYFCTPVRKPAPIMPLIIRSKLSEGTSLGVWHITEPEDALLSRVHLSGEDDLRLGEIRNGTRRKQWLACRAIVQEFADGRVMQIRYTSAGQPYLPGSHACISLSHAGHFAATIYSTDRKAGIDIELLRERIFRVADRFMSEEELKRTAEPDLLAKLYIHWSAKEAIYKLYGGGLDIRNDIVLGPFDYLCNGFGTVSSSVISGNQTREHPLRYLATDGWIMVYTLDPSIR